MGQILSADADFPLFIYFWLFKRRTSLRQADIFTKTHPCNEQRFFSVVKNENFHWKIFNIFLIVAQNINCGYTLEPPRPLCFGAKIRKIDIPLHTPVLLYKSGIYRGIRFKEMFSY